MIRIMAKAGLAGGLSANRKLSRDTLVLYRMRPTVSAHVSREVGRGASDTAV
jgi:hypothetical protein